MNSLTVAGFPSQARGWFGALPEDWSVNPLKFVVTYNDEALSKNTDPAYEIEYADISSVELGKGITATEAMYFEDAPSRARRLVKDGDTLISTVRTYLKAIATVENASENLIASTGFAVLRPSPSIDPEYLGHFTTSSCFVDAVVAQSKGVSYPATNASDIVRLNIPFPKLNIQKAIARFLNSKTAHIDALIEKKRKLLELLAEKRAAIITNAVTKGINPTAPMKDSGIDWLGEIPEHWGTKRFRFLLRESFKYGANESAELDDPDFPRFIRITDVKDDGTLREDTFRSIPPEIAGPFLLEPGDILLARSGATVGKSFHYEASWGKAAFAGYLIRARLDVSCHPKFIMYFLRSQSYWQWLKGAFIQSTIQNVSAEKYSNLWLPTPPKREQSQIAEYLLAENSRMDQIERTVSQVIDRLTEYRSALITEAVTGKIKVA